MVHNYNMKCENVLLRPLSENDIEKLRNWRNNSNNSKYLNKIPHITPDLQKKWYEKYLNNEDEICFAIIENQNLKRMVGSLSLYGFENDECLFGKILIGDQEAHGQKVGLNATKAAVAVAFDQLNMKVVNLYVYEDNLGALKVYKKAGFYISEKLEKDNGKIEYKMKIERR